MSRAHLTTPHLAVFGAAVVGLMSLPGMGRAAPAGELRVRVGEGLAPEAAAMVRGQRGWLGGRLDEPAPDRLLIELDAAPSALEGRHPVPLRALWSPARPAASLAPAHQQALERLQLRPGWPRLGVASVEVEGGVDSELIEALETLPGVRAVERDHRIVASRVASDPEFVKQWSLSAWTRTGMVVGDADIDAPEAWDITVGSGEVVVAVLDTGVDPDHPELIGRLWSNPDEIPANGIDDDGNGYVDDIFGVDTSDDAGGPPLDGDGHGTACASIIGAAVNNDELMVPVAWDVRLMAVKVLDDRRSEGFISDAIEGIDYAIGEGARIINASWRLYTHSTTLEAAIERAGEAGVMVVTGAGNEGGDNDWLPTWPGGFEGDHIVSVAGVTRTNELADFPGYWSSNYGATSVDLAAPTEGILAAHARTGWTWFNGTSASAPIVAGVAALILGHYPDLTPAELRELLIAGSEPLPDLAGRVVSGGRVNARNSLRLAGLSRAATLPTVSLPELIRMEPGASYSLAAQVSPDVVELRWDHGDGDGLFDGEVTTELRYALPGSYPVGLEVINADGLAAHASSRVEVNAGSWGRQSRRWESAHPYEAETLEVQSFTVPGARFVRAHVERLDLASLGSTPPYRYDDGLVLLDGDGIAVATYTGSYDDAFWTAPVPGDTLTLLFNGTLGGGYGFAIDRIEYLEDGLTEPDDLGRSLEPSACSQGQRRPARAGLLLASFGLIGLLWTRRG